MGQPLLVFSPIRRRPPSPAKPAMHDCQCGSVNYMRVPVTYPSTSRQIYINCLFNQNPLRMTHTAPNPKIHEGRNVKRFREMLGIKQDALAFELGDEWNQQRISTLEQKEKIDSEILEQVAAILKIPAEAIRNFDEEQAVNIISNTFNSEAYYVGNPQATFNVNPIEEIRKLHYEKIELYERMLREKDEMLERLERLIGRG